MKFCISIFIFLLLNAFLSKAQYTSWLVKIDPAKYQLFVKVENEPDTVSKILPYKVFKLRQADLNNDGMDEIIVGVSKKTKLDNTERKRINIWKINDNRIEPMWLGSFLPHPLYDFDIGHENKKTIVVTIEYEQDNSFLIAEYEWHSFGLKFIRFVKRKIELTGAQTILNTLHEKQ
jgi:hypothetical protein